MTDGSQEGLAVSDPWKNAWLSCLNSDKNRQKKSSRRTYSYRKVNIESSEGIADAFKNGTSLSSKVLLLRGLTIGCIVYDPPGKY